MRKRCFILGFIGLVLGGLLHWMSYPTEAEKRERARERDSLRLSEVSDRALRNLAPGSDPFREMANELERQLANNSTDNSPEIEARKPKFVLGSNISFGLGGVLLIVGFIVGPEKKAPNQ